MLTRLWRPLTVALVAAAMACDAALAQPVSKADQQRAAVLETFGGVYEGPLGPYVTRVGDRMAAAAGLAGRCRFTVLDTDVVNAMAVPPACDVYVTRGLLGLIRSEDELAAVLGHEVGHVAARHANRRETRSTLSGLGALVLGAVTGSSAVASLASQAGQMGLLSYSRSQEFEADKLGLRYITAEGYSPMGLADMLAALQASDQVEALGRSAAKEAPAWSRTHPLTGDRIARAVQAGAAAGPPRPQAQDAYLDQVEGLTFGDSADQGFVVGRRFLHPGLGVGFTAPPGTRLSNTPQAVGVEGPDGQRAMFAAGSGGSADRLRDEAWRIMQQVAGGAAAGRDVQPLRAGGIEGVSLWAEGQSSTGPAEVQVAVFPHRGDSLYFLTIASRGRGQAMAELVQSFHRLSAAELAEARPRRLHVVTVKPGDTVATLAARMAVPEHPRETFEAINGLSPGEALKPGDRVKLVVVGR